MCGVVRFVDPCQCDRAHSMECRACAAVSSVCAPQLVHSFQYRVENENRGKKNAVNLLDDFMTFCGAVAPQEAQANDTTLMIFSEGPMPKRRNMVA